MLSHSVMSNPLQPHGLYSPLGSSVHGIIIQAPILEWVAISSSRGFSQPRNWTHISCTAGRFFTAEPPWGASFPYTHTTNISNAHMSHFLQTLLSLLHRLSKSWLTCLRIFSSLKKGSKLSLTACLKNSNDIYNFIPYLYTPHQETTLSVSFPIFIHAPGPTVTSSNLHIFYL